MNLNDELAALLRADERKRRAFELALRGPCDRCGDMICVEFADDLCTACGHVPLCVECSWQHADEAREDGTYRS